MSNEEYKETSNELFKLYAEEVLLSSTSLETLINENRRIRKNLYLVKKMNEKCSKCLDEYRKNVKEPRNDILSDLGNTIGIKFDTDKVGYDPTVKGDEE